MKMTGRIFSINQFGTVLVCGLVALLGAQISRADDTWVYAVQISAMVQTAPPEIALRWHPDPYGATNYIIYRKAKEGSSWGLLTNLPGSPTNYTDTNVVVGGTYEYQIIKQTVPGYTGYGYIFAGIEAPLTEARGKLILIVANTYANDLSNELARLENDLTGDGWTVIRHDVSSADTPASVRNLIISDYFNDTNNVNTVFLFGHVPVFHSGNINYDGHLARPMPADAFYGDVSGDWSTSPDFLPADVKLMVGRVDMFDMPGEGAPAPWPTEVELLRNYLNKDHEWRQKTVTVPQRALMGDRRGAENGEGVASTGYRNFEPMVGPGNTIEANVADVSAPEVRWGPMLEAGSYLWAYGCGGGDPRGVSHLGTNGQYNFIYSTNVVSEDSKAVFVMLFGSWFGNWDETDNFVRAFLATPTLGLAACMAGRPHWFVHHMGLGETIGYGTRLSMNNSTLYRSQSNAYPRAIYTALMGDPALRTDLVSPPSALNGTVTAGGVNLTWSASPESVLGYHVYRRSSPTNPFVRLTTSLLTSTNFADTNILTATCSYMVRAVKLQTTPSGTYFNASQGIFASVAAPIQIVPQSTPDGFVLTWNSQSGAVYRVLAADGLTLNWIDVSGNVTASGTNVSWTNTGVLPSQRFYRLTSP
jgi:hypothetical protein